MCRPVAPWADASAGQSAHRRITVAISRDRREIDLPARLRARPSDHAPTGRVMNISPGVSWTETHRGAQRALTDAMSCSCDSAGALEPEHERKRARGVNRPPPADEQRGDDHRRDQIQDRRPGRRPRSTPGAGGGATARRGDAERGRVGRRSGEVRSWRCRRCRGTGGQLAEGARVGEGLCPRRRGASRLGAGRGAQRGAAGAGGHLAVTRTHGSRRRVASRDRGGAAGPRDRAGGRRGRARRSGLGPGLAGRGERGSRGSGHGGPRSRASVREHVRAR